MNINFPLWIASDSSVPQRWFFVILVPYFFTEGFVKILPVIICMCKAYLWQLFRKEQHFTLR